MSYLQANILNQQDNATWAVLERDPLEKIFRYVSNGNLDKISHLQKVRSVCRRWRSICTEITDQLEVRSIHDEIAKFFPRVRKLHLELNVECSSYTLNSSEAINLLSNLRELSIDGLNINDIEHLSPLSKKTEIVNFNI